MANAILPIAARRQIVIVDACVDDYACLVEPAQAEAIRLTITSTGAGGLRLASSFPDALWMISTRLPDMRGLDLLEMLRSLLPQLTAFVVDSVPSQEHERQALQRSATKYLCKPVELAWIEAWRGPHVVRPHPSIDEPHVQREVGKNLSTS